MAGYRTLEITLQYAKDLNKVTLISKMNVYVVVSISGAGDKNSKQKTRTTADRDGDGDPMWRFPMRFEAEEAALRQNRLVLDFELKCEKAFGDRDVGEVHVAIKDLLESPADGGEKFVSYQVMKPNGKPKGQLTFSYLFRPKNSIVAAAGDLGHGVLVAPSASPPTKEEYGEFTVAYPVLNSNSPYPPTVQGGHYPPLPARISPEELGGQYLLPAEYPPANGQILEWYPPPPWCSYPPPPPPPNNVYPPPLMQLAPNWWIVDWRYNSRCC